MPRPSVTALALVAVLAAVVGLAVVAGADAGGAGTQAGTIELGANDSVTLAPADGANGAYASTDEDGDLRVDLDALNRHGTTAADRVFTIESDVNRTIEVAVEGDADVSFYWGGDPGRDAARERKLEAGETVAVGVAARAGATVDGGNLTLVVSEHVQLDDGGEDDGDDVSIGRMDRDPTVSGGDDAVEIAVPVTNTRPYPVTRTFELSIDGVAVDSRTITLGPGETATLVFERSFRRAGSHDVAVNGHSVGTVTVEDGAFAVSNASVAPAVIERGETATVTADVTNEGAEAGTFVAELEVGGAVVDRQVVHVAPGATETVRFERTFDRKGGYEVAVSGEPAGTVQVESAYGASVRRYGAEYGPLLGVLTVPSLAGALVLARSHDVVLVPRPAK